MKQAPAVSHRRHGIIDNVARDAASHRLPNYHLELQRLGYETAHIGKWYVHPVFRRQRVFFRRARAGARTALRGVRERLRRELRRLVAEAGGL